jgi:hypothetical protein
MLSCLFACVLLSWHLVVFTVADLLIAWAF